MPLADGRILSPHEPGLSVLVLPGFWLAGLRGAQVELMLIAAATLALAYVLTALETRRLVASWLVTAVVGLSATAFVYSTEVYPEVPAAFCVVASLLVLRLSTASLWPAIALALLLSALAWLSMKYVPLGGLLALAYLLGASTRQRALLLSLASVSAAGYVWFHLEVFGGLTAYSVNTVYEGASTGVVLGDHLAFSDRVYRLWGLFIDQRFGIGRWTPLLLLVLPALPLLFSRGRVGATVAALIAGQLLIGTFAAITMMGWWFPGRTLMAVLPLFALVLTALFTRLALSGRLAMGGLGAASLGTTALLTRSVNRGEVTLAVDPFDMPSALFQVSAHLFPNYTAWTVETVALTAAWLTAGTALLLTLYARDPASRRHWDLLVNRVTTSFQRPPRADDTGSSLTTTRSR